MSRGSNLRALFHDLRRRKVFRAAGAYIVVAWIAFEIASGTYETAGLPAYTPLLVLVLAALGVPLALVLAWAWDITPEGVERTPDSPEKWRRAQRVLEVALELPEGEQLPYIRGAAGSDHELRNEVIALLAAHHRPGPLDRPPTHLLGTSIGQLPLTPAPGHIVAHYEILQELGDGGMGIVYRARDRRLQRIVALKFLPPHLSRDAEAKQRMLAEAQAAAALDHPHVCTLLEIGEVDGQVFLAMPCYDGETLKHRMTRGRLSVAEALDLAVQAASGLTAAHAKGIIHRDIKPANLIITSDGVLKILDFGIAKLADTGVTMPGQTPGTAAYMSPEQSRGGPVDARSDVWSLGVVLYESLAGRRPFGDLDGTSATLTTQEPAPLSAWRSDVPAAVDAVLRRALAADAARRYRSGGELHEALNELLAGLSGGRDAAGTGTAADDGVDTELPPEGERRQATVVMCTVGGYAELVESATPEQVHAALSRVRSAAEELAERFGGRMNSFDDDRIELLFGVPVSHEDHCFRGIRAALDLHERVRAIEVSGAAAPRPLGLHSGVDTGHVLAQPGADGMRLRLIGDPVRAAARLQAHAGHDELWITPACHRVVGAFFETAAREPLALGGGAFARPYRVLRLSGMNTRIEAARLIGLTRYVGRDLELAHLRDAAAKAHAGSGQALTIHGEAGVGKSRLLHEFRQTLAAADMTFLEGRCQSFGGGVAYLPFIDVLRTALVAERGEPGERALAAADAVRAISAELEGFIPLYLHLLSLPHARHPLPTHLHGEALRHAMQEALAALVTLLARTRPVVLLLEDWHWADDASTAVLRQILEIVPGHALLVVVTSRSHASHVDDLSRLTVLPLEPLGPDAGADMLRTVLGACDVPADLAERIHGRTGGNPFFIEEVGRALIEEGALRVEHGVVKPLGDVQALHLPETVEAVIRGRLDRLDRDTREIARLASAVGREFERRLLEQAMHSGSRLPHALQALKSAGLVQQIRVVPDAAYRFNHALTQEVAYSSLLERQRVDVHGRVAEAIERVYTAALEEHYTRLADHFARAHSWARAVHYGVRAADRLMGLSAFTDALEQLERCEDWIGHAGGDGHPTLIEVLLRQERLCETLGLRARQQQLIDRLIALIENTDDRRLLAEAYIRQGDLFTLLRRFDDAERVLLESLRLRRELDDVDAVRNSLRSLGLLRWHADRPLEAIALIEETLDIDRQRNDDDALVGDLSNLGAVLKSMGNITRARAVLEEALTVLDGGRLSANGAAGSLKACYILHNLANVHRQLGEVDVAMTYLDRATHLMELDQLPIQNSYHFTSLAHLNLQQGRLEESLNFYRQAVETSRRAGYTPGLSQALRMLGEVLLGVGRENEALPCLTEAAGLFAQLEDSASEARLWRRIAGVHDRAGAATQALEAWRRVAALADVSANRDAALEAQVGIAIAGRRAGLPPDEVRAAHHRALESAIAAGAVGEQGRLLNNLGIIAWEHADYAEALRCYEAGLALYRTLDDAASLGLMLNSLAATLKAVHRYQEARVHIEEALRVHRRSGNRLMEGHAFALLGDVALALDDRDLALRSFTASLALRAAVGDRLGEGWMHNRIASTHVMLGRPERAAEHVAEARRIAEECADGELVAACEQQQLAAQSA